MRIKNSFPILIAIKIICGFEFISAQSENLENRIIQKLFNEYFLDSMCNCNYFPPPIPPRPPKTEYSFTDDTMVVVWYDTLEYEQIMRNYPNELERYYEAKDKFFKDSNNIVIGIEEKLDYSWYIENKDYIYLEGLDSIYVKLLTEISSKNSTSSLNLDNFSDKVIVKPLSYFPQGLSIWKKEYDFRFCGIVGFSKIMFDRKKEHGVLYFWILKGRLNGYGLAIFIRKIDKQWKIEHTRRLWVS